MTEFPFNVCGYQFRELDAARAKAIELRRIYGKPGTEAVTMAHPLRRNPGAGGAIMLDVTTDAPEAAVAAYDAANPLPVMV